MAAAIAFAQQTPASLAFNTDHHQRHFRELPGLESDGTAEVSSLFLGQGSGQILCLSRRLLLDYSAPMDGEFEKSPFFFPPFLPPFPFLLSLPPPTHLVGSVPQRNSG